MVEKSDIEKCFTELQWIKDKNLRDKVVEVWKKAFEQGGWKNIDDVPFTLLLESPGKLSDHTKRIANLAKTVYDQREEKLNLDFLIAGALLHDVGKPLEYAVVDGKVVKSEYGKKFRHPFSGALLAKEIGLPNEVILIIYSHSYEGDKIKRSPEAVIVNHCDFIDFDIKKSLE